MRGGGNVVRKWNHQVFNALISAFFLTVATLVNLVVGGHLGNIEGSSVNTKLVFLLAVLLI